MAKGTFEVRIANESRSAYRKYLEGNKQMEINQRQHKESSLFRIQRSNSRLKGTGLVS